MPSAGRSVSTFPRASLCRPQAQSGRPVPPHGTICAGPCVTVGGGVPKGPRHQIHSAPHPPLSGSRAPSGRGSTGNLNSGQLIPLQPVGTRQPALDLRAPGSRAASRGLGVCQAVASRKGHAVFEFRLFLYLELLQGPGLPEHGPLCTTVCSVSR